MKVMETMLRGRILQDQQKAASGRSTPTCC
jgi:hypothetical protein